MYLTMTNTFCTLSNSLPPDCPLGLYAYQSTLSDGQIQRIHLIIHGPKLVVVRI
jgi:hypothetical protein